MASQADLWRVVFQTLGETQVEQAKALGMSQQSISERVTDRQKGKSKKHSSSPAARYALALAAAAAMEGPRVSARIVKRALELFEES